MKIVYTLILALIFTAPLSAQKRKKDTEETADTKTEVAATEEDEEDAPAALKDSLDMKVYQEAVKYADINTAISAMYRLIVQNPARTDFRDSLITLYYYGGNNAQVVIMGREFLEGEPDNTKIMEFVANSEKALGRNKEALEMYEKLFPLTKNLYHAYQKGVAEYALKRYGECASTMKALSQLPAAKEQQIVITASRDNRQNVPLNAAALNLLGVISLEMNDKGTAKQYFDAALKEMPDFVLAKANLMAMDKMKEEGEKKK